MAEELENVQEQPSEQMDIKALEALVFNEPQPASATNEPIAEPATVVEPTALVNEPVVTPVIEEAQILDPENYLKTTYGYGEQELKSLLQEYKTLKETSATPAEIKFADDQSKKIHELIRDGKTKEVKAFLEAQELLSNVDTMSSEQQLKLYIKMQNPRFDEELINDEYDSLYKIDEAKFMNDLDEVDQVKARKERIRLQQRVDNDVAKATEYFAAYKQKIQLPDIQPREAVIDEGYEAYKTSSVKQAEAYEKVIVPSVNALKETDVQMSFKVDDPNNQMNFDLTIVPDKTDFDNAKNASLDYGEFINQTFYDEKGNFLSKELAQAILLQRNIGKYAQSIARQAVNAERKRVIEKEATGGVSTKNYNVEMPNELREIEKLVFPS